MLNILSLLIGIVTLPAAMLGFIILFGWMYWFILPFSLLGLAIGALSSSNAGRNLNLVVLIVGVIRLALGHGIF